MAHLRKVVTILFGVYGFEVLRIMQPSRRWLVYLRYRDSQLWIMQGVTSHEHVSKFDTGSPRSSDPALSELDIGFGVEDPSALLVDA